MLVLKEENFMFREIIQETPYFFLNSHSCSFTTMCFFCGQRLHEDKVLCKQKIITRQIKIVVFQIIVRSSLEIGFNFQEQQERATLDAELSQIQNSRAALCMF